MDENRKYSDSNPLVSIVIVTYRNKEYLRHCLESVPSSSYRYFEIIIFDNSPKYEGCESVYGSYENIMKLDDDTEVNPYWLTELIRILEADENIGIAQSRIIQIEEQGNRQIVGGFLDPFGYDHVKETVSIYPETIFYADGAAFIIRKELINKISINGDLYDADYFIYFDEVDICWRALLAGSKIVSVPISLVYHRTKKHLPQRYVYFQARNRIMTLAKNHAIQNLIKYLPPLILLEILRMIVLLKVNPSHSMAITRTFLWNLGNIRKIITKRRLVQQKVRRMPGSYIMRFMAKPSVTHLYKAFRALYRAP